MSDSQQQKEDDSEWEESLDATTHSMLNQPDAMMSPDSEVIRRFLVTKDKTLMAMGSTTKYLEVLYDGSVRIRDVKKATYSDPIFKPWQTFKKDVISDPKPTGSKSKTGKTKTKKQKQTSANKQDKLKIYMDGRSKKRYFKFSTMQDKKEFFKLIEDLRLKKDRGAQQKKKYSTEAFIFAPYEVVGFFIRNGVVYRAGSSIKHRDKLIAITNYRIVVIDPDSMNPSILGGNIKQNTLKKGDHIIPALTIPHHSVYEYTVDGDVLKLETKDYRTISIDISDITNSTLRTQSLFMMERYLLPSDDKDIFAFAGYFSVTRCKTPSHSETDISKFGAIGFPETTSYKPDFQQNHHTPDGDGSGGDMNSHVYSQSQHTHTQKRKESGGNTAMTRYARSNEEISSLFSQLADSRYHIQYTESLQFAEYKRLGWSSNEDEECPFRVTFLNESYDLCATYPKYLLVPRAAKDNLIQRAAQHRSRNRLPVITWSNSYRISLARSSQPQAGASHKRNEYDERLLLLLNEMNSYSETFVICDCRPRVNAIANQYMKGKGFESGDNYEKAHIIFFDIQNIHEMRKSVNALKKCCDNQFDKNWLKNLHETGWFQHITKIIQCSRRCANMIDKDKYSVLVHCSDGWDRTAQVCCLSELLLDPYYRTFDGFLLLIQKEWLWFGHKFADRNSNYDVADRNKHNSKKKERSPIFLQFLDCCFQVMMQFPWAFDFTQDLLLEFAMHCNSGRFGDFFANCVREREEHQLWLRTPSLFKYLSALWRLGRFRNPDYIPTKTVLRPRYAVRDMILWDEVYCRFTMHDKDRHCSSMFTNTAASSRHAPPHTAYNYSGNLSSDSLHNLMDNHQSNNNNHHNKKKKKGKNRYQPRSPRITPQQKAGAANESSSQQRTKPPPPPPKPYTNSMHNTALIRSDTSNINVEQTGLSIMDDDDDDDSDDVVRRMTADSDTDSDLDDTRHHNNDDSDSASIPEKVQRITLLQKKVKQLESILKEYRNKEELNAVTAHTTFNNNNNKRTHNHNTPPPASSRRNHNDDDNENNNVHNNNEETNKQQQSKGNIV